MGLYKNAVKEATLNIALITAPIRFSWSI